MFAFRSLKCSRSTLGAVALAALGGYLAACAAGCGGDSSSPISPPPDGSLRLHSPGREPGSASGGGGSDATVGGDTTAPGEDAATGGDGGPGNSKGDSGSAGKEAGGGASGKKPGDAGGTDA